MADNDKRLLELPDINYSDDLYFMTEKSGSVTSKIQADKVKLKVDTSLATAGKAADAKATGDAINAEAAARQQAISSEVTDRNSAISAAIGTEVTNRNAAIAVETENRQAAYQDLDNRKAEIDGYYDELSVGNADQLIPSAMETERVPYNFRTSGGSLDIGDREFDKLVGLSLPWNQLVKNGNFDGSASNWGPYNPTYSSIAVSNHVLTQTIQSGLTASAYQYGLNQNNVFNGQTTHKYYVRFDVKPSIATDFRVDLGGVQKKATGTLEANKWTEIAFVNNCYTYSAFTVYPYTVVNNVETPSMTIDYRNIVCIDLTQLFGSTIADYIYSLETATAGAGVAWFKKFFPKQYYAYNSGEIESVKVSSHDMVGFNQWDEEWENGDLDITTGQNNPNANRIRSKNYIHVLPNTKYYKIEPTNNGNMRICHYDANKNFLFTGGWSSSGTFTTEPNEHYIRFFMAAEYGKTYKNNICINLSWDGARDGEYEPYKKNSYELDPIELRGILKLDSNNEPYADGDTYEADGTVTRKYGIVDLGTLTWRWSSNNEYFVTEANLGAKIPSDINTAPIMVSAKYRVVDAFNLVYNTDGNYDKTTSISSSTTFLLIRDSAYSTPEAFKTAMSGVYLVYELATPTTETADPFTDPQTVDNWGTEQYVDKAYTDGDRDVEIPVGHETKYPMNLRDKLETAPNAPTIDGDYIVHCESGQLTYIALGSTTTIQNIISRLDALEGGE